MVYQIRAIIYRLQLPLSTGHRLEIVADCRRFNSQRRRDEMRRFRRRRSRCELVSRPDKTVFKYSDHVRFPNFQPAAVSTRRVFNSHRRLYRVAGVN